MGKRGPSKKPTALKVLEGNPGKKPLPENEPKPAPLMPNCPEWLDDEAKWFWNEYGPKLNKLGLLTEIDGPAFIMICKYWSDWVKYSNDYDKNGVKLVYESGHEQIRVEVSMAKDAAKMIKSLLQEFGMTAASRSNISLNLPEGEEDKMEGLLSGVK